MVIMGEMDPKVTKLVNLAQIWTCRPLLWSLIHQRVMLEGPESPKSPHKLVQPENVSIILYDHSGCTGGEFIVCLCILKFWHPHLFTPIQAL